MSGHLNIAAEQMMQLNKIGQLLGGMDEVTAMTDVTGFGLLGHLVKWLKAADAVQQLISAPCS